MEERESLDFVEDFGQKVDLTQRIREVLANYPEGTTILKELVQNADDAGARRVCFCLDRRQHGVESLVYSPLGEWQGPALLAHNDAQFTDEDFESISRIGDSKKRSQAWKTGRFGVGFNSVYHLSDVPSFVSGRYAVFFDPHCKYLPSVSAANPGKRIDFVSSSALRRHRDQFDPYCAFGCDMKSSYPGTLFRFPLRNPQQAAASRLSRQSYSEDDMSSLLFELYVEAVPAMLFLKNVEIMEIYDWQVGATGPTRLYSCRVQSVSPEIIWHRQAFARLSMAQSKSLSQVPNHDVFTLNFVSEAFGGARKGDFRKDSFLISQCMGSATSRIGTLARNAAKDYDLQLVPWASVAARMSSDGQKGPETLAMEGRAFCFLPLPTKTALPVHVNGYFELSSNRRDIWYGHDMDRGGKLRSDWNVCLLEDVVALAYSQLLLEASRRLGPEPIYYSLWPSGNFSNPWVILVKRLYTAISELPVLYTMAAGGKWLAPTQALYHDEEFPAAPSLAISLVSEGLPLVRIPDVLRNLIFTFCVASPQIVTPGYVRAQFCKRSSHGGLSDRARALVVLEYCLEDVLDDEACAALKGLPLIPLADGGWGVFGSRGINHVFLGGDLEFKIFEHLPSKIVDRSIAAGLFARLENISRLSNTNLCPLLDVLLVDELPYFMPREWEGKDFVEWRPEVFATHPKPEWFSLFWKFLREHCKDLSTFASWPLLPSTNNLLFRPLGKSRLIRGSVMSSNIENLLSKLRCTFLVSDLGVEHPQLSSYVHDASAPGVLNALLSVVQDDVTKFPDLFKSVTPVERREMRNFLYDAQWHVGDQMTETHIRVFHALPLFEAYPLSAASEKTFVDLNGPKRFLAPADMEESLLGPEFLCTSSERETEVLVRYLGIRRLGRSAFYKWRVLGRVTDLSSDIRNRMLLNILRELPQLCVADPAIKEMMKNLAFIPNGSGNLRIPRSMYDPRNLELAALLDDQDCFPVGEFALPEVLDMLHGLGLRTTVTPETVIQSARQVEAISSINTDVACARGRSLLTYLELNANKWFSTFEDDPAKVFGRIFSKMSSTFQLSENSNPASDAVSSNFWTELITICWCPVLTTPPYAHLPWPSTNSAVAPPKLVRLQADMWLASASMRILDGECRSSALALKLGWASELGGNVLAAQLLELGRNNLVIEDQRLGQALATVVPRIYTSLNKMIGSEEMEIVKAVLEGCRWVWVGDGFASVQEVAFSGPLHLAPYLRVIPTDLAVFKELLLELGVRETLTPNELALVLESMAKDLSGAPLNTRQLSAAIWLVQHLADLHLQLSPFVPDVSSILVSASELVYNDAPWLSTSDSLPTLGHSNTKAPRLRFVHPKISSDVAERLGVRSLRRLLLAESADSMDLGLHEAAEAFGQHEALTTRLKHIVEMYADGPGILCELVQNADDAGAKEVNFLLDKTQYGISSVLSPRMAEWQGAALYCQNDSVFTPRDLYAISRIGQDSKLEKPSSIGRFGLGFNSVYHFTDIPGFISGENLVMFDPHACNLPGITPSHPGLKISFVGRGLLEQFPDQFRPYLLFGCDLQKAFPGTLFRFPLRNSSAAARSEIKQEIYSPEDVLSLFSSFQSSATEALLFLRNVTRICVYLREDGAQKMQQLYCIERRGVDSKESHDVAHKQVHEFVRGDARNPIDKEQFYRKLQRTSEANLPWHCGKVEISVAMGGLENSEAWLISNAIGGGRAREQSIASENRARGFVPWSGVAAPLLTCLPVNIDTPAEVSEENGVSYVRPEGTGGLDVAKDDLSLEGRAFCFLPLPVRTGLPVHVNGYFELSSNRRDIWSGDDLSGGGKVRSNWNTCLLEDVTAPAYARLLAQAAQELGPGKQFYSLWPIQTGGEPWRSLMQRVYLALVHLDLHVMHTAVGRGKWISAKRAVFPDNSFSEAHELSRALAEAGFPIVGAPDAVVARFREFCPSLRFLTPHLLRKSLIGKTPNFGNRRVLSLALKYCLGDVEPSEADKLAGLALLPLANGTLGAFARAGYGETILLARGEEYELLHEAVAFKLLDRELEGEVVTKLQEIAQRALTNLSTLTVPILEGLLPRLIPSDWRGRTVPVWTPGLDGQPTTSWLESLWKFLSDACEDLSAFSDWPLLPTSDGQLLRLTAGNSSVLKDGGWSENMAGVLQKARCHLLRHDIPLQHPKLGDYVHDATAIGVLSALLAAAGGSLIALRPLFTNASDGELRELRSFLCQSKWFVSGGMSAFHIGILRALPVFESYGSQANGRHRFVDLPESKRWFAPDDVEEVLLGESFVRAESVKEEEVLMKFLGVSKIRKSSFYRNHVFCNIPSFGQEIRVRVMLGVLQNLSQLMEEDPSIFSTLSELRFVSTEGGVVEAPQRLYDPRVSELQLLLSKQAYFPSRDFAAVEILDVLVTLGLRRSLGREGLLDGARSVAMMMDSNKDEAVKRGRALLSHLNNLEDGSSPVSVDDYDGLLASEGSCQANVPEKEKSAHVQIATATVPRGESSKLIVLEDKNQSQGAAVFKHPVFQNSTGSAEIQFWKELTNISWCPVFIDTPEEGLPWPDLAQSPIAPPKIVRPKSQMWLVSATMRILDGECHSRALLSNLGWSGSPNLSVLAAQLIELSKDFADLKNQKPALDAESGEEDVIRIASRSAILSKETPKIYKLLQECVGSQDMTILQSMLEHIQWVWVGDGFVSPSELAFDSPAHFYPYLHVVPSEIAEYRLLLTAMGVREAFGPQDYADVLQRVSRDVKGSALTQEQITFCLRVLEALGELLPMQGSAANKQLLGTVLIPDVAGVLVPAKDLVYNDAPWLAKSVLGMPGMRRLVHPEIENDLAEKLGAKSLRYLSLVDQEMTSNLPCLSTSVISEVLTAYGDEELLLFDLLEVADCCKARKMHIVYDKREHPKQSLLQPNLGQFQGPALTVAFEGAALTAEEICNLQGYPPTKLRGQICDFGSGLLSLYNVTDLPFIVSSGCLYLFDPSGQVLAASLSDGQAVPSGTPVGKAYSLSGSGTDLPRKFVDQFRPLRVNSEITWRQKDVTIVRMPLRTTPNSDDFLSFEKEFGDKEIASILNRFKTQASCTLLFLNWVEDVSVTAWDEDEHEPRELFSVRVDPARVALRNPFLEKKWRKFQLTSLFGGFNAASRIHSIDVMLTEDGQKMVDKWIVVQTLGSGHTRDIALDRKYLSYNLTPVGGVAAHLTRNGSVPPSVVTESYVMTPLPLPVAFGLPVTIIGQFLVSHRAGHRRLFHRIPNNDVASVSSSSSGAASAPPVPDDLATTWNKELLSCVRDSYIDLLQELQRLRQDPSASKVDPPIGRGLDGTFGVPADRAYSHWPKSRALLPSVSKLKTGAAHYAGIDWACISEWLIKPMYVRLAELPVWQLHGGAMAKSADGMFLAPPGLDRQGVAPPTTVCDFLKAHYRVFVVPWELTKEMEAAGVAVKEVTPKMLRNLLKSPSVAAAVRSVITQVDLLEYCCADITFQEPEAILNETVNDSMSEAGDRMANNLDSSSAVEFEPASPARGVSNRSRQGLGWPEQFVPDNSRGTPGISLPGGEGSGLVADIGRVIADIGRGVMGEINQRTAVVGVPSRVIELKGLQCPVGTNAMSKLGTTDLWVGSKEQQGLIPSMAGKFVHHLCLERPSIAELFHHSASQSTLRLRPFSHQLLAENLRTILPKQWVSGSLSGAPWVTWEQGPSAIVQGPSPDWLRAFWKNVNSLSSDELDLFSRWPLVPAVTSVPVLTRLGRRNLVFVPPFSTQMPDTEAYGTTSPDSNSSDTALAEACMKAFMEIENVFPWLLPLLHNCSVPVYDRRFLDCSVLRCCLPPQGQSMGQTVASKMLALQQVNQLLVSELALMPADCDVLFRLFSSSTTSQSSLPPTYTPEEITLLRSLPIFKTVRGEYVALDRRLHCIVPPTAFFQPADEHCLQYVSTTEGGSFYRELGIPELLDHEVLSRFALPGYDLHGEQEKEHILAYVFSNWDTLKQQEAVVSSLKNTKFVQTSDESTQLTNNANRLCSPQKLLDPENPLLKLVFASEAGRFPGGQFATSDWLHILRDAGLRSASDAEVLLECAKKVEQMGQRQSAHYLGDNGTDQEELFNGVAEVSPEIWSMGGLLMETILANFASLYGSTFCESLSRIACVPAEKGISTGGMGRGKRVLASYNEAVLLKDWSLAWTCAPILARPGVIPPEFSWGSLSLRSPPPFSVVLKHLQMAGKNCGEDVLARWPNGKDMKSVEGAFSEVLKYLSNIWDGLSNSDKEALREVPFIPVANGTRLAIASALYARINMDLAPFIFELPSAYLPYVNVLGQLGMQEAPSVEGMKHLLQDLQQSCGYRRLNPNELHAVLRILKFICDKGNEMGPPSQLTHFSDAVVPDDGARLIHARACVYVDSLAANLMGDIELTRIKFVHPLVRESLCVQLGVQRLSNVVEEKLDENRSLEIVDIIGQTSRMSVAEKLKSQMFIEAVWGVVMEASHTSPSLKDLTKEDIQQTLNFAAAGLWFVRSLYTRYWLIPGRIDITKYTGRSTTPLSNGHGEANDGHRVFEFIDKERILIAEPPDYISLADLLAVVVSRMLGSPTCLPISALLKSPYGMEDAVKHVLRLGSNQTDVNDRQGTQQSGFPGMNLVSPDAALIQFHPLRPFHAGEIVAWQPDGSGGQAQLRYGRVVDDVRASAGQALYRLQVETGPGEIQILLSSQVYSFKATAAISGYVHNVGEASSSTGPSINSGLHRQTTMLPSRTVGSSKIAAKKTNTEVPALLNITNKHVSASEIAVAVKDMLAAAGMPIDLEQHVLLERNLALQEQLGAADTALSIEQKRAETALKEAEAAKTAWTCRVCINNEVDTVVVPCGHVLCHRCSSAVTRCPFCRRAVSQLLRIYRP